MGRRSRSAAVLLALLAAVVAVGCGSEDAEQTAKDEVIDISGTARLGEETAGSVAQLAQCRDWNRGNEEEKLATIADIRNQVDAPGTGLETPLSDEEALGVFDKACEADHAQGFRLYILYARAAGFAPLARAIEAE